MSPVFLFAFVGIALGAIAGAMHLAVVRYRTHALVRHGIGRALALYPVGLLPPAAAVIAAARFSVHAAWCVPVGILLVRSIALVRARAGVEAAR